MADYRRLKSISSRYDLEVQRHRDPWRLSRSRLSLIFAIGTLAACVPWLLGDHRAFESRCVSNAHRRFEQSCNSCHDQRFSPLRRMISFDNVSRSVSDKKCQACHAETATDHLAEATSKGKLSEAEQRRLGELAELLRPNFSQQGCATCHSEHRGHAELSTVADGHCAACHTTVHKQIAEHRFELKFAEFRQHPEFGMWRKPEMSRDAQATDFVGWKDDKPIDRSSIRFSHHRHMDPQLLDRDGKPKALDCTNCHQLDQGGAYFRPIQFEEHCRQCHKLGFKSTGELPHASPEIIRDVLVGSLLKNLPNTNQQPVASDTVGGPTKPPIQPKSRDIDVSTPLDTVLEGLVAEELKLLLFEGSSDSELPHLPRLVGLQEAACTKCHFTARPSKPGELWSVLPTNIPSRWMTHSRFHHDRHAAINCVSCHTRSGATTESMTREEFYSTAARQLEDSQSIYASNTAQDILLPRIDVCHQCHAKSESRSAQSSANDRCVSCHDYHHTSFSASGRRGLDELLRLPQIKKTAPETTGPVEPKL